MMDKKEPNNEWYSPLWFMVLVRRVMPRIELDPFSCAKANERVRAERYFTKEDDAYKQHWEAKTLYMNPPFSPHSLCRDAIAQLAEAFNNLYVDEYICLLKDGLSNQYLTPIHDAVVLSTRSRPINLYNGEKEAIEENPGSGHLLFYNGPNKEEFIKVFLRSGAFWMPNSRFSIFT